MEFRRNIQCWFLAAFGAVIIGATLPVVLVMWNSGESILDLSLNRCLSCWPGAFFVANILFAIFAHPASSLRDQMIAGLWFGAFSFGTYGAVIEFLNIIRFASFFSVSGVMMFVLLFGVVGASIGAWVAWQGWRATHPAEKFWPRFSLGTLLIVVFAWGALLAVFAPR